MNGGALPSVWLLLLLPFVALGLLLVLVALLRGPRWPRPAARPAARRRRGSISEALLFALACLFVGLTVGGGLIYLWTVGGLGRVDWGRVLSLVALCLACLGAGWFSFNRPHGP